MAIMPEEQYLPATLTCAPMTDAVFAEFCAEHPDLFFEMTADGELIVMPPNYTLAGIRNKRIVVQLELWAISDGRGTVMEASGGFVLPNGARRSPDAAWIANQRIRELAPDSMDRFWHLCPDFVIELRSSWDRLPVLRNKMREWIDNGAALAWLIDPESRSVEVFRAGAEPITMGGAAAVDGEGPVAGFRLDLAPVWEPLRNV